MHAAGQDLIAEHFRDCSESLREKIKADMKPSDCVCVDKCPSCGKMSKIIRKDLHEPGKYPGEQWENDVPVSACCEGRVWE